MPIHSAERIYNTSDPPEEIGIRLNGVGEDGFFDALYPPGQSWNPNRLNKMVAKVQDLIDVRTPLSDPSLVDDPRGPNGVDPARPESFWDDGDLVARSVVIRNVWFDDAWPPNGRLMFEIIDARLT